MSKAVLLLASTLFASSSFASPYILGEIGFFGSEVTFNDGINSAKNDDVRATGRLGAGYMWYVTESLDIGLEGAVQFYQNRNYSFMSYYLGTLDYTLQRQTYDALAVIDWYPFERWDLFAKAGPAFVKNKLKVKSTNLLGVTATESDDDVVPKIVLGLGFQATPMMNLNLAYTHEFKANHAKLNDNGASTLLAGVRFSFS